ncbi:helix-turn-helix transcriptional regulator [Pedobacter nototheniae]|uniref:helix-turn-helix transcriptional regulator n=1 Tax=Pedobacter nototheniae TaxID=2488994 RepID=UPI00292FBC25|nr:helix-turn-helix transcriptional regulator [Pedobacter nototheniae]
MEFVIIKPECEILKNYVQYFLFFKKTDNNTINYTTFPNNNLCLAIYKQNKINYINSVNQNNCTITSGKRNFTSKFYGFHKMPFQVEINSFLDQICIVFYPSALRAFTFEGYENLMKSDQIFEEIFAEKNHFALEEIFECEDFTKRARQLESLLLKKLRTDNIPLKLKEAFCFIEKNSNNQFLSIEMLSKHLDISDTTLFRLFKNHLGQNPKSYLKTIRFRNVLTEVIDHKNSLTEIAYLNEYYDQAHFIKDFKKFSGLSPKGLIKHVSVQQNDLAWIYNES